MNHSSIPFFDLAQVGGFGIQPSVSWTHRGFKTHRFYDTSSAVLNLEYRYNVWQYGDYGADWVFFSDLGKVFNELQAFGKGRVKVSYGTGVRIKAYRRVIFTFQLAHSNEGLRAYVRTKTAF